MCCLISFILFQWPISFNDGKNTLSALNNHDSKICSDDDLTAMRRIAFNSHFMSDVGRVQDNHLLCSAWWGRRVGPEPLPPSDKVVTDGHQLWVSARKNGEHSTGVDMLAK